MRHAGILVVAAFSGLIGASSVVSGQPPGSAGTLKDRNVPKSVKPKATDEPTQKTRGPVRIIQYRDRPITPTTGRLFVSAEPGAKILLEPLNVRYMRAQKGTVPQGERGFVFSDLKPGDYRVAATLAGYHEVEKSPVTIKRNQNQNLTLNFEPITYTVTIKTNVNGELKYGKKEDKAKTTLPIQNKSITLQLSAGNYEAEIEPAEPVYRSELRAFSVTEDRELEFPLKRIEFSKDPYFPQWTPEELRNWEVPSAWGANSGNLIVTGAGVALPRDESKRYYQNFEVTSTVKMTNDVAVGFALRAQNSKNYYLLQLTGQKADEPLRVRLYAVQNGVEQRIQTNPIPGKAAAAIKSGEFFDVHIKVNDNRITVDIEIAAIPYPLGTLIDSNHTFAAGAVGIAARTGEQSVVWRFYVCTDCPKD
jgi:hypothetical protein